MLNCNLCIIDNNENPICNVLWLPRYTCKYYTKCILDDCRYRIGVRCHHSVAIDEATDVFERLKNVKENENA